MPDLRHKPQTQQLEVRRDPEAAWIIEWSGPGRDTVYLGFQGGHVSSPATVAGMFAWSTIADNAIMFAREVDAILFIGGLKHLQQMLPHGSTIPGLRVGDEPLKVVWRELNY